MQQPISKVSLSVRELVEFILASGSIDNRGGSADLYQRANEGSRLHRKLQRQAHERHGKAYRSEVVFSDERELDGILFSVYGRADGVLREDGSAIIEEIKTTELPLSLLSGQPDTPGCSSSPLALPRRSWKAFTWICCAATTAGRSCAPIGLCCAISRRLPSLSPFLPTARDSGRWRR